MPRACSRKQQKYPNIKGKGKNRSPIKTTVLFSGRERFESLNSEIHTADENNVGVGTGLSGSDDALGIADKLFEFLVGNRS